MMRSVILAAGIAVTTAQNAAIETSGTGDLHFNLGSSGTDYMFEKAGQPTVSLLTELASLRSALAALQSQVPTLQGQVQTLQTTVATLGGTVQIHNSTHATASSVVTVQQAFNTINSTVNAITNCPAGTTYRNSACQPLTLVAASSPCTTANAGALALTNGSLVSICAGGPTFTPVSVPAFGSSRLRPAASCQQVVDNNELVEDGQFWLQYPGMTSPERLTCDFTGQGTSSAVGADLGGDGTTPFRAAASCVDAFIAMKVTASTSVSVTQLYINSGYALNPPVLTAPTRQSCDFPALKASPFTTLSVSAYATPGGTQRLNQYAMLKFNATRGTFMLNVSTRLASGSYSLVAASGFAVGDLVMIHQTQYYANNRTVGTYEWARVDGVSGSMLTLHNGLQNNYYSNCYPNSCPKMRGIVTQIIKAIIGDRTTVSRSTNLYAQPWDGKTGGLAVIYGKTSVSVAGNIYTNGLGFRGGPKQAQTGCSCQAHVSAGYSGESWTGLGDRDNVTAGFGCCSGSARRPAGYGGRALPNQGGGGGGSGACHGGGGAGGSYSGLFTVSCSVSSRCGSSSTRRPGDGIPECTRAGSYASRGLAVGDANMTQLMLGSGGGGGNGYSPGQSNGRCANSREINYGGAGGGTVYIEAGPAGVSVSGTIQAKGLQGGPVSGSSQASWWQRSNSQDGSGGGGSGGGIAMNSAGPVNIGRNKLYVAGGSCGIQTGWGSRNHQLGGAGSWGRIAIQAPRVIGQIGSNANTRAYTFTRRT